ncbi:MAG TPA: hypothetical protein VLL97_10430, partial [Acidobacteriota bacterium]|nr:hypothetical protein [Acidobacteriota bacterium]
RIYYPPVDEVGGLEFLSGEGRIVDETLRNSHRAFRLANAEPVRVRIQTYAYPNWVARLDGRKIESAKEPETGLIMLDLPAGEHMLTLDYEIAVPIVKAARIVSLFSWVTVIVWMLWKFVLSGSFPFHAKAS